MCLPLANGKTVQEANWQKNPEVLAAKKVFQANQKDRSRWTSETKKWDYCQPHADTDRTIVRDERKVARIYIHSGGSDDASLTRESHYDKNGKLRFVFIAGGAANGSALEHRIYYRANGDRFWQNQKYTAGPGYSFPKDWPENDVTKDPEAAMKKKHECGK